MWPIIHVHVHGSCHQVGARFVTVSTVTSVNVPSIILDYKCTFTVVQIRMKSISPPSIGNYNNVNLESSPKIIYGTFTDVTIDTVTNRAPTWWNDPHTCTRVYKRAPKVELCQAQWQETSKGLFSVHYTGSWLLNTSNTRFFFSLT